MTTSPRLSFKGYKLGEALARNIDSIKAIIAIISGINVIVGINWKTFILTLSAALVTLGVKLLQDAIEFYFKEVDL